MKTAHFIPRYDADEIELQLDTLLPFADRNGYRKKHMYRGWQLETVEELHAVGECTFTTTRSNFGYRVLNSPDLGAVDVDFDLGPGIVETHIAAQQKEALSNIRDWVAAHPEQCWRVYRTAGGLRMIRTDAPQPLDETYVAVGKAIEQSDRLYCKLCKEQMAFRLRISPKVARIGANYPGWSPCAYPEGFWDHAPTPEEILAYDMLARQYKVADLIEVVGVGQVHPALVAVLRYHDDNCRVESSLPMERPAASEYVVFASISELIAFNDVYRLNGIAPDQIWENLDSEVRRALRALDGDSYHDNAEEDTVVIGCSRRELLVHTCKYLDRLFEKWHGAENYKTFDVLYAAALEKYKEDASRYVWVPSPGEHIYGLATNGHWQTPEDGLSRFPDDPRYWQLENPTASATTSAVIRFLPSRDNQRYVQKTSLGVMKHNVSNILVVNDPKCPANNGKVFLFRYGFTIEDKLKDMTEPPPEFTDMISIDPWDMKTGANLKLRPCLIDERVNLDKSSFDTADGVNTQTPVGDDAVIADLLTRVYSLDEA